MSATSAVASLRASLPPPRPARLRVRDLLRGPAWPFVLLFGGWPLWWALGLAELMPLVVALVMGGQLLRRRPLALPRGSGWWLLFLAWVVLGAAVLWVDAPGAVPGGDPTRLVVFAFRLSWYVACTVFLVWVTTLPRSAVPDRRVHQGVAWIFVVATAGGLLAMAAPTLEWTTPTELLVPGELRSTGFVQGLLHVQVADLQSVLGTEAGRPKAPFAYTNTWGSAMALTLLFGLAWLAGLGRRRARRWAPALGVVALLAVPPVLYSLNRGLWGSLALAALGLTVLAAVRGRRAAVVGLVVAAFLGGAALLATPLGEVVTDRLDNQHSNDRRGELLSLTTRSVTEGSPVVGFGNTRDVQGSFASIVGGPTPDCPACGVPPLGTQGQLWTVLFSQGWVGLGLFGAFLLTALSRSWRCRTVNETLCTLVLAVFALQLPIYDTLGLPFLLVMLAIGLVAREQREATATRDAWQPPSEPVLSPRLLVSSDRLARDLRRGAPVLVAGVALGLVAGLAALSVAPEPPPRARAWLAITPAPVYLDPAELLAEQPEAARRPREITVDTEAALLLSEETLDPAAGQLGTSAGRLRDAVSVTGEPNSNVLVVHVAWPDEEEVPALVEVVTDAYFETRRSYLEARREDILAALREQLRTMDREGASSETRLRLTDTIAGVATTAGDVGEVIRVGEVRPGARAQEVYAASGAGLGLLAGSIVITLWPRSPRRRDRTS